MTGATLTAEIARELLHYDSRTGALTWRPRAARWFATDRAFAAWNTKYVGTPVGSKDRKGYVRVKMRLFDRAFLAHRLVWLIVTGEWPPGEIDHIDHNRSNNRWDNLRSVSTSENQRNRSRGRANTSGAVGVSWHTKGGKWRVQVASKHMGYFVDFDEAVAAQREAVAAVGYHPNHGADPGKNPYKN